MSTTCLYTTPWHYKPIPTNERGCAEIELFRRTRVLVPARSLASTAFLVTAVRAGEAPVIAEANGNGVSASMFRTIEVKVPCMHLF